jgi:hypothetical protein
MDTKENIIETLLNDPPYGGHGAMKVKADCIGRGKMWAYDNDNDPLYYYVKSWGDGTQGSDWMGPYNSGEEVNITHQYPDRLQVYFVWVKVKDDTDGDGIPDGPISHDFNFTAESARGKSKTFCFSELLDKNDFLKAVLTKITIKNFFDFRHLK